MKPFSWIYTSYGRTIGALTAVLPTVNTAVCYKHIILGISSFQNFRGVVEKLDTEKKVKVKARKGDLTGTICAINVIPQAKGAEGKKQSCAVCVLKNDLAAMHSCDGTDHQVNEIPTGILVKFANGVKWFYKYGDLLYNCKRV